jgi:large subunit ribosomal protein L4
VEQANQRIPIAHTKTRGEVSGSGVKPWRQKGTGRARAGSVRSPIWRGGGIVFGPRKDRDFHKKINQKMKQKALAIVLSSKIRDKELKIIDALSLKEPKTKLMAGILEKMGLGESTLILAGQVNMNLIQACRNLPKIEVRLAQQVTPLNILQFKNLLITEPTIKILEGRL